MRLMGRMMRPALAAASMMGLIACTAAPAASDELATSPGQPFCYKREDLQEYLLALINKDEKWLKELDCYPIVGGAKVAVIEEYPSDTDVMHVVKVRIFSPIGKGSVVGYTVNIGVEKAK